jgi:uncharacterized LabA/DUF88 family protein
MKKPQESYAFIDGQNLNLSIQELGWKLDFKRFRVYLREKYGVRKAYYFIGFVEGNNDLYASLQSYGYVLIFKPTFRNKEGKVKGNCDAEIVLQAMIDLDSYQQAVIVTGDGDLSCLVEYLRKANKLLCVLAPNRYACSKLLEKSAQKQIAFMNDLKGKLEYKRKEPYKDGTS